MRFTSADFMQVRKSVLAICVSIGLGMIAVYSSNRFAEQAGQNQRDAQRLLNEAQNKLATARMDRENMSVYSDEYGALEKNKIIGEEQRLDWLEGLEKLRHQKLVIDFHYNIAPQKDYAAPPAINRGNFNIRYSAMKLQFDLLHEVQLLNFFDALRSQIKGRYQLESCTLQRVNADMGVHPHIKAECSGGWITLQNRNKPQ